MRACWCTGLLFALLPLPLGAQSLPEQLRRAPDGTVRLSFASRAGVCGSGPHSITILDHDGGDSEWEGTCERGPVRVSMKVKGGHVQDSETHVGGRWRSGTGRVTDLGLVPSR